MSEEKPTFKVTDRRLFNPDGTPREDVVREEPPEELAPGAAATQTAGEATPPQSAEAREAVRASAPPSQGAAGAQRAEREQPATSRGAAAQPGPASDPTAFANLVMFIASPAAAAMGMTEHPGLAPGELDLPLAKHCVDLLATLREKTRGNLSAQENEIIESLLAELRMQYVSLTSARPSKPSPRGFTGGDITGGR